MTTRRPRQIVDTVVQRHAEDAAFLWLLRADGVGQPHYALADLAKLENRLDAHLDGLRVAGDAGWDLVRQELKWEEPGEVFVAAVLALEAGDTRRRQAVSEAVAAAPETVGGFASALGWLPYERVRHAIAELVRATTPALRRAGLAGAALHREDPGACLRDAIAAHDPLVTSRALRAAGELGRLDLLPLARQVLFDADTDAESRYWAAWTLALHANDAAALEALRTLAASPIAPRRSSDAITLAARRATMDGAAPAVNWIRRLADGTPAHVRLAIQAAGATGDPQFIPELLERMAELPLARAAGEAFSMITGVDLAYQDLDTKPPADHVAGPTEDPADESVAMDPDENLPWPDAKLVRKWWSANKGRFTSGARYLLGKPLTAKSAGAALRVGFQRQRAAAAMELTILQPGTPLFEVRAPAARQREQLEM